MIFIPAESDILLLIYQINPRILKFINKLHGYFMIRPILLMLKAN